MHIFSHNLFHVFHFVVFFFLNESFKFQYNFIINFFLHKLYFYVFLKKIYFT